MIRSLNAVPDARRGVAFSEGLSVGGGTITNSGTIEGPGRAGQRDAARASASRSTGNDITSALDGTRDGLYGNAVVTTCLAA